MDRPIDTEEVAEDARPAKSRMAKLVPIAIVILVVVAAVVVLSRPSPGTRTNTDTSVAVVVSSANGAQSQSYPIQLLEGNDPGHEADHIIEPLRGLPGVATATLDWSSGLVLVVDFDPQQISADEIAQVLMQQGYLTAPSE